MSMYLKKMEKEYDIFFDISKNIFNTHPKLESFSWVQFTPYFSGDVFRVDIDNTNINGKLRENSELSGITIEIIDFLKNFDNDFYLSKFGDHSEITIKRSGDIIIDEFHYHD